MKIVHIHFWYSEGFGYTENMLPRTLASLGHEVHLITSNTQIYWYETMYTDVYEPRLGSGITACGTYIENGVTIYRLPHYLFCPFKQKIHQFDEFGLRGLYQLLEKIKPDVIQTQGINLISTYHAAKYARLHKIKLFTENHIHKSVFNPKNKKLKNIYNLINPFLHIINRQTVKCFPIAPDAKELAHSFYKVPNKKNLIQSLGVDNTKFYYKDRLNRTVSEKQLRRSLNIKEDEILVIYTGRFTQGKNPLCLAEAIDYLIKKGEKYKGLFIGNGDDKYIKLLQEYEGCILLDFKPVNELPIYYWIADIGVWPSQESMSQLDALSCGLPLVLSNKIEVMERIEGNGFLYEEGDVKDLSNQLLKLKEASLRITMGEAGAKKVKDKFSWQAIAKLRIEYYLGNQQ